MTYTDNTISYPDEGFFVREAELYSEAFEHATKRALRLADELDEPYSSLLRLLGDCRSAGGVSSDERTGASYRQLAYISYRAGMGKEQRQAFYEIARHVPLAGRHAGHLIARMNDIERGLDEMQEYLAGQQKSAQPERVHPEDCQYLD